MRRTLKMLINHRGLRPRIYPLRISAFKFSSTTDIPKMENGKRITDNGFSSVIKSIGFLISSLSLNMRIQDTSRFFLSRRETCILHVGITNDPLILLCTSHYMLLSLSLSPKYYIFQQVLHIPRVSFYF